MRLSFLSERFSNDFNSATTQMNLDSLSRNDVMFSEKLMDLYFKMWTCVQKSGG